MKSEVCELVERVISVTLTLLITANTASVWMRHQGFFFFSPVRIPPSDQFTVTPTNRGRGGMNPTNATNHYDE